VTSPARGRDPGMPTAAPAAAGWGFLRSGRWIGLVAGALVVSAVCVLLGSWQWGRYEQKVAAVERIDRNWEAPTTTIDDVVSEGLRIAPDDEWRTVELRGRWVPGSTVLVRNRPVAGAAALRVLGVLAAERTSGGPVAIVVARGWVPPGAVVPALPPGERTLTVRLRAEEATTRRAGPPGQVYTVHVADVLAAAEPAAALQLDTLPVIQGWSEAASPEEPLRAFPPPERQLGSHLSYAFQWWFFAAAVPAGVVVLARRERQEGPAGAGGVRSRRRLADEVAEDELIEAQLASRQASATSSR